MSANANTMRRSQPLHDMTRRNQDRMDSLLISGIGPAQREDTDHNILETSEMGLSAFEA